MGAAGILMDGGPIELLDGCLVRKPVNHPPHRIATKLTLDALTALLPAGWYADAQEPLTLGDTEPEPDVSVIRGSTRDYHTRHPGPAEVAHVVEVVDSSVGPDRDWKRRIYARNGLPVYRIVNLVDGALEVYTDPSGPVLTPGYATARFLSPVTPSRSFSAGQWSAPFRSPTCSPDRPAASDGRRFRVHCPHPKIVAPGAARRWPGSRIDSGSGGLARPSARSRPSR